MIGATELEQQDNYIIRFWDKVTVDGNSGNYTRVSKGFEFD